MFNDPFRIWGGFHFVHYSIILHILHLFVQPTDTKSNCTKSYHLKLIIIVLSTYFKMYRHELTIMNDAAGGCLHAVSTNPRQGVLVQIEPPWPLALRHRSPTISLVCLYPSVLSLHATLLLGCAHLKIYKYNINNSQDNLIIT